MMSSTDINSLLGKLGLTSVSPGSWSGSKGWSTNQDGALINVRNPANGTVIGQVRPASPADYESVIESAVQTAATWRTVPAPKRGEAVHGLTAQVISGINDDAPIEGGGIGLNYLSYCRAR